MTIGDNNEVHGIYGKNERGQMSLGNNNNVHDIVVNNEWEGEIKIGNFNKLCPGLNLSNPFSFGKIKIGDYNRLGDGGGGVISSSYRFGKGWGGITLIGSHVETTRGAEVLGLSLLGWRLEDLERIAGSESAVQELYAKGNVGDVIKFLESLWDVEPKPISEGQIAGLYGVVAFRRGCLVLLWTSKNRMTRILNDRNYRYSTPENDYIFWCPQ